jgi:TorA maturation chaperone TorD
MNAPAHSLSPEEKQVLAAAAEDLLLLARLHDSEPGHGNAAKPVGHACADWFSLQVKGDGMEQGLKLLDEGLSDLSATRVDELWVDYADLYLTFGKRIAPNESYWLTDDHIERQDPMFEVRDWYAHYALQAPDWRKRADDHLVHELQFVASLLKLGRRPRRARCWPLHGSAPAALVEGLSGRRGARANTAFYAGLALATGAILQSVRALLEGISGEPRHGDRLGHTRAPPTSQNAPSCRGSSQAGEPASCR